MLQVLALAAAGWFVGEAIRKRVALFRNINLPASVVGGMCYALIVLLLRNRWLNFDMEMTLQPLLMTAAYTAIGMSASFEVLRRGGQAVVLLLLAGLIGAVLQNAMGMSLASAMGLQPAIGILAGAVSLAGGPATSLAFGPTFESMGIQAATTVALASAVFGISVSNVTGGILGGWLLTRSRRPRTAALALEQAEALPLRADGLFRTALWIAISMGVGTLISSAIAARGIVLPGYIGAMLAAAALRNLDDRTGWIGLHQPALDVLGSVSLNLFIVMALLTLKLWELAALAIPVVAILVAQVFLAAVLTAGVWRMMGRDSEATVMAAGWCGFMLGTTANSMATMMALESKAGPTPRAFIAVPVVGASLIDFTNSIVITQMANLVK
jgi:ESS family glutamate:Na+ symporter